MIVRRLAIIAMTTLLAHCTAESPDARSKSPLELADPRAVIGDELMVALHLAKNLHHKADVYLQEGQRTAAVRSLRDILSVQFPHDAPEAQDVVFDARARLAKLLLTEGKLDEALTTLDQGLRSADRDSFFLANLHTVRGEVLQARGDKETKLGNPDRATAARMDAIRAFNEAIRIDTNLQKRLMRSQEQSR